MKLREIFQSVEAWGKLASVNMKPKLAYQVLKYVQLVTDEHTIAEKQRVALLREITGSPDGSDVLIKDGTPEFSEFVSGFNAILAQESTLEKLDIKLETIVDALDGKDDVLSISDLAALEPFFAQ